MKDLRVGIIGLGNMGLGIGHTLLRKGYQVTGYDLSSGAVGSLVAAGGKEAASPKDVAAQSGIVITVLPNGPDVEKAITGPDGVLAGAKPGTYLVECSTIAPEVTRAVGELAKNAGCTLIDAAMGGFPVDAEAGTLILMVGAEQADFDRLEPLFQDMARTIHHCGGLAAGVTVKLINNLLALSILNVNLEAPAIGRKAGVKTETMLQVFGSTAAANRILETQLPNKIMKNDHVPGFRARLAQKDLGLAQNMAASLNVPIPSLSSVRQLYALALARGQGDEAHTTIAKVVEDLNGISFAAD